MKLTVFLFLTLLIAASVSPVHAQQSAAFHVTQIAPYDKAVPGQIMQLLVEGLEGGASPLMLPAEDFKLSVSQDGVTQDAKIRTVTVTLRSDPRPRNEPPSSVLASGPQMHAFQSVNFIVPQGLHKGEAELMLFYRGQRGNSLTLNVIDKPLRPVVGTTSVMTISPGSLPPPGTRIQKNDLGWRLERGSTASLFVSPLTDPDDPNSAVMIRFKQGDTYYDAQARVKNTPFKVENRGRGVGFFPARDILEVDIPSALTMGPAEVEIRLRVNGQESEPAKVNAFITDVARSAEAPAANAPRLLLVTPNRVGAGQSLMLSLDYRRTLDPDPSRTVIIVEQGNSRYIVRVERSTLAFGRNKAPDAPVAFFVRTTRQIIGKAQVRILNQLRGEQTGMSEPFAIEIVDETLPPEVLGVNESTEADLAPMRQRYEIQAREGRKFPAFDPQRKYATIRARGIDYNPRFVRITIEQDGQRFTVAPEDFSSYSGDELIIRLPKELKSGEARMTIENRGAESFSRPVSKIFEICCTP
jgi:hypothetical protein